MSTATHSAGKVIHNVNPSTSSSSSTLPCNTDYPGGHLTHVTSNEIGPTEGVLASVHDHTIAEDAIEEIPGVNMLDGRTPHSVVPIFSNRVKEGISKLKTRRRDKRIVGSNEKGELGSVDHDIEKGSPLRPRSEDETICADEEEEEEEEEEESPEKGKLSNELELPLDESEEVWEFPEGGFKAWSVVLACFIFISAQMGYGLTWGVWVAELHSTTFKETPLSTLNLIVGTSNFFAASLSFVAGRLGDIFGYKRMISIGAVLYIVFLVISAFVSNSLPLLFVFQGFGLGLAQGIGMPLYMSLPAQWFLRRRGLATGLAVSGSGIGGGIASLILRSLLPRLHYKNTLLVYAGMNAVMTAIAFPLLAVRTPPVGKKEREMGRKVPKNWLPVGVWRDPAFYSLMGCIFLGVFGFLTPFFYLTVYTQIQVPSLKPGTLGAAIPLVIANFVSGIGRICAGLLADRFGPINTLFASFFLGGLFQIIVWPLAHTYGTIIVFAILYGFVGSWFLSLLPVATAQLFGLNGLATITGFAVCVNSPGQFAGATFSGLLLTGTGGNYKAVAYYSGSVMFGGSLILLYARFSRERRIFARF